MQITALIFLLAIAWMPSAGAESLAAKSVRQLPVRGVVRPFAQATISTDLTARVVEVGFKEGAGFKKGEVLIVFDCRRFKAKLASAEAQVREMLVAYESASFLEKRNASNRQEVETTRARADEAAAEAEAIRARIDQCRIIAPFDGSIAERSVNEHEIPVAGKQLFYIVSKREPKIELIVPSTWLTWLKPGVEFRFDVDETKKSYVGVVRRLGAAVDTVSQTIKVFARFVSPTAEILPGMSGTARFGYHQG